MSFPCYEKYKDSGVDGLGEVPEHWKVAKLQSLAQTTPYSFVDGPFGSDLKNEEYTDNGVPLIQLNNINEGAHVLNDVKYISEKKATDLAKHNAFGGDIVIAKMADPVARAAIVINDFNRYVIVADCIKLSVNEKQVSSSFVVYTINSKYFRANAESLASGITRLRINLGVLKKLRLALPPFAEQSNIVSFLDGETTKIDELIAEQQQLIKLLKEKRQAVISHAVTKGLNPDVPMKDSGIEWLGEVPEHWVMTVAKRVASVFVPQRNKPVLNDEKDGIFWATMDDMKTKEILGTSFWVSQIAAKDAGSRVLERGSVITSCIGNFGVASINLVDLVINQQLQAYIPKSAIKAKFLRYYLFISKGYFEQVGTAATITYVNQQGFENLPLALPPLIEQENIISYLDLETTKLDALTDEASHVIELLRERRTALISTAVTGKIDVRSRMAAKTALEAKT